MKPHYLKPGEAIIASGDSTITTVLGSCVSVTFYSPPHNLGGMTHGVLPFFPQTGRKSTEAEAVFRYVDTSIEQIVKRLTSRGITLKGLRVKVFGGADVLGKPSGSTWSVGRKNVEAALQTLARLELPIERTDVGGEQGRKIIFSTLTGQVLLKRLDGRTAAKIDPCPDPPCR
jgi:chemotaxis protein CheD